jgi:hypothetical protein
MSYRAATWTIRGILAVALGITVVACIVPSQMIGLSLGTAALLLWCLSWIVWFLWG